VRAINPVVVVGEGFKQLLDMCRKRLECFIRKLDCFLGNRTLSSDALGFLFGAGGKTQHQSRYYNNRD
jgi:hypothetical protein